MADTILFSNNAITTLTGDITNIATSATVADGSVFASPAANQYQVLVLMPAGLSAIDIAPGDVEIVYLTSRATDTLTITRAQESTSNVAWSAGTVVAAALTSGIMSSVPQGFDSGGNAKGTDAVELQAGRDTDDRVAGFQESTTVGYNNKTGGVGGTAIGRDNDVLTGIAAGQTNACTNTQSDAFGHSNKVYTARSGAFGIGCIMPATTRTGGVEARSIGHSQYNALENGLAIGNIPFIKLPVWPTGFDNAGDVTDLRAIVGLEVVLVSHPVCIGDGPAWSTGATKYHGDVVIPIAPNNYSYYADVEGTDYWTSATTHASTEPTWPTTAQDSVNDNSDIDWICMDPTEVVYLLPDYSRFIPKEVGFITDRTSGSLTTNPELHFGTTTGDPDDWLQSTAFSQIGGAYMLQTFPVVDNPTASKILVAGMDTAATGNCTGRFFWRGILVETMES